MSKSKFDKQLFIGIITIAVGITLSNFSETLRPAGFVMIGLGGFLVINYFGKRKKNTSDEE